MLEYQIIDTHTDPNVLLVLGRGTLYEIQGDTVDLLEN